MEGTVLLGDSDIKGMEPISKQSGAFSHQFVDGDEEASKISEPNPLLAIIYLNMLMQRDLRAPFSFSYASQEVVVHRRKLIVLLSPVQLLQVSDAVGEEPLA